MSLVNTAIAQAAKVARTEREEHQRRIEDALATIEASKREVSRLSKVEGLLMAMLTGEAVPPAASPARTPDDDIGVPVVRKVAPGDPERSNECWTAALDEYIEKHGGITCAKATVLAKAAGANDRDARSALQYRLNKGSLERVRRGVYGVPKAKAPVRRSPQPAVVDTAWTAALDAHIAKHGAVTADEAAAMVIGDITAAHRRDMARKALKRRVDDGVLVRPGGTMYEVPRPTAAPTPPAPKPAPADPLHPAYFTHHALERYREHFPEATEADIKADVASGQVVDREIVALATNSRKRGLGTDHYVLPASQRGFVVVAGANMAAVTYLRMEQSQAAVLRGVVAR